MRHDKCTSNHRKIHVESTQSTRNSVARGAIDAVHMSQFVFYNNDIRTDAYSIFELNE